MTGQHQRRPGNARACTVRDLARQIDRDNQDAGRSDPAGRRHVLYHPVHLRALRLVDQGRIRCNDGTLWRRHGELSAPELAALETLLRDGYITPNEDPDRRTGSLTVVFTEAGQHLFDRWTKPLSVPISPELGRFLLLRRLHHGHITRHRHTTFTDRGHPIPAFLLQSLRNLIDQGHARLVEHPEYDGEAQIEITPSGEALFVELQQKRATTRADRAGGDR